MNGYHLPLRIKQLIAKAHGGNDELVLVTGVFDVLHKEHLNFLMKAKQAGDVLLVGVESDERVRAIKGPSRPVNDETVRIQRLDSLSLADGIFLLPEKFSSPQEHRALIRQIRPDVLAVSSHTPYIEAKQEIIEQVGGELRIVHQHNPEISSTILIEKRLKEGEARGG